MFCKSTFAAIAFGLLAIGSVAAPTHASASQLAGVRNEQISVSYNAPLTSVSANRYQAPMRRPGNGRY